MKFGKVAKTGQAHYMITFIITKEISDMLCVALCRIYLFA